MPIRAMKLKAKPIMKLGGGSIKLVDTIGMLENYCDKVDGLRKLMPIETDKDKIGHLHFKKVQEFIYEKLLSMKRVAIYALLSEFLYELLPSSWQHRHVLSHFWIELPNESLVKLSMKLMSKKGYYEARIDMDNFEPTRRLVTRFLYTHC